MKTYNVEGIGSLGLNPTAETLASLFKILRIVSFVVFGLLALYCWYWARNNEAAPYSVSIPGLVSLVAAFVFWGLEFLVMRRLYHPGDLYQLLERSARAEKGDYAREAARGLLKLASTDLVTYKLKARAHQYLAQHLHGEEGKGHQEQSLALLAEIIEQEPNNPVFRLDRARFYQRIQRYADALQDIEVLVSSLEPPSLRAYSMRISCLVSLDKQREATEACGQLEKNLSRFPNKREATEALLAHRAQFDQPSCD